MFIIALFIFQLVRTDKVLLNIANYTLPWYSGYLNKEIFYTFFESQSSPHNDPLFFWIQGGPGCSSLFGLFYEIGPFIFTPLSNETKINPYAWNKKANLLFMELPKGVGFSTYQRSTNDAQNAIDTLNALKDFYVQFPNFTKNDFYIGGESYAGMYIPYLVDLLLIEHIPLKGFMIGNGCTLGGECSDHAQQPLYTSKYQFEQYFNRAFFSLEDKKSFDDICSKNFISIECVQLQRKLLRKIDYTKVDMDNILGYCYHNDPQVFQENGGRMKRHQIKQSIKGLKQHKQQTQNICSYEYGDYYLLNNKTIQQQLHAHPTKWQTCSNLLNYKEDPKGSFHFYQKFIDKDLHILIYSGDVDSNVPITGTLTWLQELKLNESDPWRPWYVDGKREGEKQVGGMTWAWSKDASNQTKHKHNIRFASIRGAGHEVPFWKPQEAFVLFNAYLNNEF